MIDINELKNNIFNNPIMKNVLNELKEDEKKQTLEVIDNLLGEMVKNGGSLFKAIEQASKNKEEK